VDQGGTKALVRSILAHAAAFPWRMQEVGLLGLWLDERKEHRLHVWAPEAPTGDPPIHDHPFDFTSTVVVGELVNTRYVEDAAGDEYVRERRALADESDRRVDTIRLVGEPTTFRAGDTYQQRASGLHDSRQAPGTVTLIRFSFTGATALTTCRRPGAPAVSSRARRATPDEVARYASAALTAGGPW
jgi:hypothetical protein